MGEPEKVCFETLLEGTHPRVLIEIYPMDINIKGYRGFPKYLPPSALEDSSLCIGRINTLTHECSKGPKAA